MARGGLWDRFLTAGRPFPIRSGWDVRRGARVCGRRAHDLLRIRRRGVSRFRGLGWLRLLLRGGGPIGRGTLAVARGGLRDRFLTAGRPFPIRSGWGFRRHARACGRLARNLRRGFSRVRRVGWPRLLLRSLPDGLRISAARRFLARRRRLLRFIRCRHVRPYACVSSSVRPRLGVSKVSTGSAETAGSLGSSAKAQRHEGRQRQASRFGKGDQGKIRVRSLQADPRPVRPRLAGRIGLALGSNWVPGRFSPRSGPRNRGLWPASRPAGLSSCLIQ